MGRERTGGDFATRKARQSVAFCDVSIRAGTAGIEFQDRCLKPLTGLIGSNAVRPPPGELAFGLLAGHKRDTGRRGFPITI
jgi:hypothetical protein